MADKTSYTVEVYDPQYTWGLDNVDPEENWVHHIGPNRHNTFAEAEEAAKSVTGVYRSVRIRKHVWSEVALYQDGVSVG